MKTKAYYVLAGILFLGAQTIFGQSKTEKFEVKGTCGMCEQRIENAAKSVEGVSFADWNKKTKEIKVTLDPKKTNVHKIHKAVAKAGHDTKMHKAKDEVYNALPGCCKYDREMKKK